MKTVSHFLAASVGLLLTFGVVNQTQAIPITYTYIGSPYSNTNAPAEPGFTLCDRVIATITLDSADWGTTIDGSAGFGGIGSGPWQVGADAFHVTMDSAGRILAWYLSGAIGGLDIETSGRPDGGGVDTIFGDRPTQGSVGYQAAVFYQAGSRTPGGSWVAVPDASSSLTLLSVSLILLLCFSHAQHKQELHRGQ